MQGKERQDVNIDSREQDHIVKMDTRGRVTIPSSIRSRYGLDPDENDVWVDLTIHKVEVEEDDGGDD